MANKGNRKNKSTRDLAGRRIDMDQPVNQKITLPSALKPAEPPKGIEWPKRKSSANERDDKS